MIAAFIIGLREGLEAALIVGIIAAFLVQRGQRSALRPMWFGVAMAIALCAAVAVALYAVNSSLPFREREMLEGALALLAVLAVSYMIIWMRRHSRELKRQLESEAAEALLAGSVLALVAMAFLAVLREGFETAIFMLAAFQASSDPLATGLGAVLGVGLAVGLGYAIYRGGARINIGRFFRVTAFFLVLIAAGLLASAVHSLAEAGVVTVFQQGAFDLSWLVAPGSVQGALLTGLFGVQPVPTWAEVGVWLAYAVPFALYVLRPPATPNRQIKSSPVEATQ